MVFKRFLNGFALFPATKMIFLSPFLCQKRVRETLRATLRATFFNQICGFRMVIVPKIWFKTAIF